MEHNYALQNSSMPQQMETEQNPEWILIGNKKKRGLDSPEKIGNKPKQTKLKDYWLNPPIPTSNRFEKLDNENDKQTEPQIIETRPPPLFIYGVNDIKPLLTLLETYAKEKYVSKLIGGSQVKLQLKDAKTYNSIVKLLQEKNTEFHSFQNKIDKSFKFVIRDLHHTTDLADLKNEIDSYGHTTIRIHNIKNRVTKNPLPMFFVEIKQDSNNKKIYEIEFLAKTKVKIEPPRPKKEIPQCTRCQRYGHTKSYCNRSARCVKCAGDHYTTQCDWKEKNNKNVKCVLCTKNHPANYKGCEIYKETFERKFPPLRNKQPSKKDLGMPSTHHVQAGTSYAKVTRKENGKTHQNNNTQQNFKATNSPSKAQPSTCTQNRSNQKNNDPQQQTFSVNPQPNQIDELKLMMKGLMEQMSTMLNLLTTIVAKIK